MERRSSLVQTLARQYTNHSLGRAPTNVQSPLERDDPNSPLNPRGEKFNARAWAKSLSHMVNEQGAGFRRTGLCFQNMNIFGYGAETDYQKDVGNVWLEVPSLARKAMLPPSHIDFCSEGDEKQVL
ncbi:ABC-transporter extracellular N-terminal-domain-containing protein [Dactylonectria estremocensis]|uniref:ABC-transporter extracellular N-terminal-domain-containing protein n=1 Tax=Dactylonectria estremocensis TaxID=1079267 RepID=A0A9P9CZM4_9HYPO|nr:ABC-transporter extracellular N-terminal-domain-containing protein [Dactylonectria estremocensis]